MGAGVRPALSGFTRRGPIGGVGIDDMEPLLARNRGGPHGVRHFRLFDAFIPPA